ncbi:MAG: hypothetical protein EBW87_01080 [Burkholderiaceae bacterium]|nr:hypothetical protein [Burkholderiaceae bacterium]
MSDLVHVVGVSDGNEALYVSGDLHQKDDWSLYFVDIGRICVLSHVEVSFSAFAELNGEVYFSWPQKFEDLMPFVVERSDA